MFLNKQLLNKIFYENKNGLAYIIFQHSDKTWVLPKELFEQGMDMYQPSTIKGKILKNLLILSKNNERLLNRLNARTVYLSIDEELQKCVEEFCGKQSCKVAAYMGDTTSKQNDKATLQVFNKDNILFYIKITRDEENKVTFNKEIEILRFLEKKGISNVPKVLYNNSFGENYIFIQSTYKKNGEKVLLELDRKHIEFVKNIMHRTTIKASYEETNFYKYVENLKKVYFTSEHQELVDKAICIIEKQLVGKSLEYSFSHGDYTPWNVYYVDGDIHAFDFEYSNYSMPQYIDVFHYMTQLSLLGMKHDAEKTIQIYKDNKKMMYEYMLNPDFIYICYLIYIISFYKERTKLENIEVEKKYDQWIRILEYLVEEI